MHLSLQDCTAWHEAANTAAPPALQGLNLKLEAGEQVAVIGPSGAGKTTLLHLMAAAMQPAQGQVLWDNDNPHAWSPSLLQRARARLFLAPQTPPLPPRQRVVTALLAARLPHQTLWRSLVSLFYPQGIEGAESALGAFDLSDKLFERVDRLSGGERQRVGLARALLTAASCKLWLIDEPLSALDPTSRDTTIRAICAAAQQRQATLVTTLHHVEMALAHFPRIVGLQQGRLFFDLPAAQVSPERLQALYAHHPEELT